MLPRLEPAVDFVDGLGELGAKLARLRGEHRAGCHEEFDDRARRTKDDQRGQHAARQSNAGAQPVDARRHGEAEQDAKEGREKDRLGDPDEPDHQIHPDDRSRGAHKVGGTPADLTSASLPCRNRGRWRRCPRRFRDAGTDWRFVFRCHVGGFEKGAGRGAFDCATSLGALRKHGAPSGSVLDYPSRDSTGISNAYEPDTGEPRVVAGAPLICPLSAGTRPIPDQ